MVDEISDDRYQSQSQGLTSMNLWIMNEISLSLILNR
jgi:hypothetical protein